MTSKQTIWTTKVTNGWSCPFCRTQMRIRNSWTDCALLRRYYLQCTNVECNAMFRARMEITGLKEPTVTPDPSLIRQLDIAAQHYQNVDPKAPGQPAPTPENHHENDSTDPPGQARQSDHR